MRLPCYHLLDESFFLKEILLFKYILITVKNTNEFNKLRHIRENYFTLPCDLIFMAYNLYVMWLTF